MTIADETINAAGAEQGVGKKKKTKAKQWTTLRTNEFLQNEDKNEVVSYNLHFPKY